MDGRRSSWHSRVRAELPTNRFVPTENAFALVRFRNSLVPHDRVGKIVTVIAHLVSFSTLTVLFSSFYFLTDSLAARSRVRSSNGSSNRA